MAYTKLDERQNAELLTDWGNLTPEQQKTKEARESLALKFKISLATLERKVKGDKPAAKKKTRKSAAAKKAPKVPASFSSAFEAEVNRIVDERLAMREPLGDNQKDIAKAIANLVEELPSLIKSALKKIMAA